jgi:hypothetical protein
MKSSLSQIKTSRRVGPNWRQYQGSIFEQSDKEKEKKYKWDIQDFWDIIKRQNLWITGLEEEVRSLS